MWVIRSRKRALDRQMLSGCVTTTCVDTDYQIEQKSTARAKFSGTQENLKNSDPDILRKYNVNMIVLRRFCCGERFGGLLNINMVAAP